MALPNVNILRQSGGLSRPNATTDGVSGLIFVSSGNSFNYGTYKLSAPEDAETMLNITADTITNGAVLKYHIDEYFRFSDSPLYVRTVSATSTYDEIITLKNYSNGEINQVAVFDYQKPYTSSIITTIEGKVEQAEDEYAPLVVLYGGRAATGVTLSSYADLKPLDSIGVAYIISEDMTSGSKPALLRGSGATVVSDLGTALGVLSQAQVHESIGYVKKFNLVEAGFQDPGFITQEKLSTISTTLQNTLDSYHYVFTRKFVGSNGTYFNYGFTASLATSDFNTLENNRTYNKAFRLIRAALLPEINGPLKTNSAGKLSVGTIGFYKTLVEGSIQQMKDADELSGYSIDINPDQNVLSTSKLQIVAKLQPIGVAREIEVKLGFTIQLA